MNGRQVSVNQSGADFESRSAQFLGSLVCGEITVENPLTDHRSPGVKLAVPDSMSRKVRRDSGATQLLRCFS